MKTLLLIDAYAMIYRAYYAFIRAPRMNSRGENTSAIFGFVVTLDDLLRKVSPSVILQQADNIRPLRPDWCRLRPSRPYVPS